MNPKRLVLLVEGESDREAAFVLLKRLLTEQEAFDAISLDEHPLRIGGYSQISRGGRDFAEWRRQLGNAAKRKNVGGCLLLLDGDSKTTAPGQPFCAMHAGRRLAEAAREVGAGTMFSAAIVFACMEFESWLIAGAESLVGKPFPDGRTGLPRAVQSLPPNPEVAPRDAKGWLRQNMPNGYKETVDQAELTGLVDLGAIRRKEMRSFRRLEAAVRELVEAIRLGQPIVTPASKC